MLVVIIAFQIIEVIVGLIHHFVFQCFASKVVDRPRNDLDRSRMEVVKDELERDKNACSLSP